MNSNWKEIFFSHFVPAHGMGDDYLENSLRKYPDNEITNYIPKRMTEAIIDFNFKCYEFYTDNGYRIREFYAKDEICLHKIIDELKIYCQQILKSLFLISLYEDLQCC